MKARIASAQRKMNPVDVKAKARGITNFVDDQSERISIPPKNNGKRSIESVGASAMGDL